MKSHFIYLLLAAVSTTMAQQPAAGAPQKSISSYMGLHAFPAKNQTAAQQEQDEMACYNWAKQDSDFDPLAALITQVQAPAAESTPPAAGSDPLTAFARQLPPPPGGSAQPSTRETRGATTKGTAGGPAGGPATSAVAGPGAGDPGKGPAPSAAGNGPQGVGMASRAEMEGQKQAQQQQPQQAQQQPQARPEMQQKFDGFKKGFSACMEAKNYVVK